MKKIIVLLIALIIIGITSCAPSKSPGHNLSYDMNAEGASTYLPIGARVTKELGNGWVTFTLDDHEYLFFLIKSGNRGYSAVTLIK